MSAASTLHCLGIAIAFRSRARVTLSIVTFGMLMSFVLVIKFWVFYEAYIGIDHKLDQLFE